MEPLIRLRRCLPGILLTLAATAAVAATRDFDIPEGPASQGITRFAQQAGVPVLFAYDLAQGRRTRTLRGRFEVDDGLRLLLQDSGLVALTNSRGQITIRQAPVDSAPRAGTPEATGFDPQAIGVVDLLPEVSITGTRIERDGMTTPTPVAALSNIELQVLGPTTLIDALVQLPHFLNNDTPQTQSFGSSGAAGASYLNLRGIGSIRTLTLLDGRRTVPSTRFGSVDIALLPKNLVRSIEVVTGGASAAYGSDAVSGVVNLILDSDFRGLRAQAQGGLSAQGDYENQELAVTFGTRLGEASSLLLSGEVFRAHGIRGYRNRDWFDSSAAISNPEPTGPREIIARDVHATGYTYGGLITSGPLAGTQFLDGGAPAPFERGTLYTSLTQSGGSGVDPAADLVWILPDQQRSNLFARLTTQPTATVAAFAQLLAGRTDNHFDKDPPSLWGPWETTIYSDNAYLPQSIRDQMAAENITSFRMGRVAADGELGRGEVTSSSEMLSATLGTDWQLPDWTASGYYQFGRNHSRLDYDDTLRIDRIYRAIDAVPDPATGRVVCRSTLSNPGDGCVPVNLFGRGSVSPEARAYVTEGSSAQLQEVQEHVAEATLTGELRWLPDRPLGVATGIAWRSESVDSSPARYPESLEGLRVETDISQGYRGLPPAYSGSPNIFERTIMTEVAGSYSVWELFGEVMAPLLQDRSFARRLDLHAALRQARYSGSGTIPAWKLGLDWQVVEGLRLRATRSRDVRAGSLSERYDASNAGVTVIDRLLPGSPSYAVIAQRFGNPEVDPEKADTITAGFVLQPAPLPGFSLAADYYDIRVNEAISAIGAQNIIDLCARGDADLCALITRNPTTGLITTIRNDVLNVAEARSRGVDLEISWRRALQWFGGDESLALRAFANLALESSTTGATGVRVDREGQTGLFGGAPGWQANVSLAYLRGPLAISLQERLVSSGTYNATYGPLGIDDNHVRSALYTNLRISWTPASHAGTELYLNIQNLFDEDPPRAPDWGFVGSIPTNEGLFDALGRRFVFGVRYEH